MTKYKTLEGKEAVARFIDEHCYIRIISITQNEDDFTIFYKE